MTTIFESGESGAGTHVLIVGVGNYPGIDGFALGPAPATAIHLASWLELTFHNPAAPLSSLEMLVSGASGAGVSYVSHRNREHIELEAPMLEPARFAARSWLGRCASHVDNIALFYFIGRGSASGREILLLLDDSTPVPGGLNGVFDLRQVVESMGGCAARQQVYVVETAWNQTTPPNGSTIPLLEGFPNTASGARHVILHSAFREGFPYAYSRQASPFSRAVTRSLEALVTESVAGPADTVRLVKALTGEMAPLWSESAELTLPDPPQSIDLHFHSDSDGISGARGMETETGEPGERPRNARPTAREDALPDIPQPDDETLSARPDPTITMESIGARFGRLTPRQIECLRLLGAGLNTKQIAERLGLSTVTVNRHLQRAVLTLRAKNRAGAARAFAIIDGVEDQAEGGSGADDDNDAEAGSAQESSTETNTHFVDDDPEVDRDELGRGPLAIVLARRLHRIWCRSNGIKVPGDDQFEAGGDERSAFVLHLDAPWGGGKTSFANFLARVLNPFPRGGREAARFLVERAGRAVGTIFIDDPPADGKEGGTAAKWPEDARRPWIVVPFNAWQAEHCSPPWWTFYQAIRKGCFAAVWAEGRSAARPAQASAPTRPLIEERLWSWAALWRRELWWRLRNPKVVARLATFAVAAFALLILWRTNVIFRGDEGSDFNAGNALGFLLAGIGGVSGLWGLGALFTESVAPGTDDLAERRNLGSGDPFERFRRHFRKTIAAVRRPVMVIVDDLDRCRPDFVVDLVRGIQTLLKSPRVVFVILGDRDWIERAFEAHHVAMSKVNVGPEQDFGARFVEKAIQMSFILPEMPETRQDSYVRRVLIGPGVSAAAPDAPAPIAQRLRADYREKVASAPTPEARKQAEEALAEQYRPQLEAAARAEASGAAATAEFESKGTSDVAEAQAGKVLSEERALLAAVDERMGQALLHRLEPLARFFPSNPRQIKRIVNAITMYTAVAYLQMEMDENDPRGIELAIWVIIMTEWPKTWRVLASCPKLADVLAKDDPAAALAAIEEGALPGSEASTLREVNRIRADRELFALVTEEAEGRPRLHTASVEMFVRLTPLYSRKRRLKDEAQIQAGAPPT